MEPRQWQRVEELFERALEVPEVDRNAFLVEACSGDVELQAEVAGLLSGTSGAAASLHAIVAAEVLRVASPAHATGNVRARTQLPPRLADRFVIRGQLGAGGMGVVYEAYDEQRRELVALKAIERGDPHRIYQLKREFRALADVVHPRLVRLHELFTDGEQWFFTMERIEGVAFLDHVRRDGAIEEPALRAVLLDVVDGLSAIHHAGKLHRDLKPSNVLVANGRAVILDFGLVAPATETDEIVGTPAYMAPELFAGGASTASDWYAVGVMLYEALAGARPFAPLAGPPDLMTLATRLIARDPADRPDAAAVAAALGGARAAPFASSAHGRFVGRTAEFAILDAAFRATGPRLVRVEGPSGIGKSALIERFLDGCRGATVLRGRCYERENLPFKALDAIVDALARDLASVAAPPPAPAQVADLCRIFPVLGRVFAPRGQATMDPPLARSRAFGALAELLAHVARTGPLVIAIDDLQWSDADSAVLLRELLESGIPALWIAGYRSADASVLTAAIDDAQIATRTIALGPLDDAAAGEFVRTMWAEAGEHTAAMVRESGGNPFFLGELVRSGRSAAVPVATLAAIVGHRLDTLTAPARQLLEVVAIAGAPVSLASALSAAGLASDVPVPDLRALSLIRTNLVDRRVVVETYHDKIREAVIAGLAELRRGAHHLALADALELEHAPAAVLARHLREGGARARARAYTLDAANSAGRALAFDRAAELYREAIELSAPEPSRELERALGDALAHAGRGPEAAEAYLRAAHGVDGDEYVELARRAAHQYLWTGHVARGRAIGWSVIVRLGMWIPRNPLAALLVAFVRFGVLLARGFRAPSDGEADDPVALRRYDAANEMFQNLANHEPMPSVYFAASASLRGSRLADPMRRADAIGTAAALMCLARGRIDRRIARWLREQRAIAEGIGRPAALAVASTFDGVCAVYTGAWRQASEHFADAERWFAQDDGIQLRFQLTTMQAFDTWVLFYRGELAELVRRARHRLAEARIKNNVMAANAQATHVAIAAWLVPDDVAGATRELAGAERRMSTEVYGLQHTWLLIGRALLALYTGDASTGYARMVAEMPAIRRSRLLGVKVAQMSYLATRAALALASADGLGADARATELRREAGALARRLARLPVSGAAPLALLIRAPLARDPRSLLEHARRDLAQAGMLAYAHAAGWHLGGEPRRAAEAFFAAQQVTRPERVVAMLAPGFAHWSGCPDPTRRPTQ
jgi:tetratricopeptide (TPR) repeat protein